MNGKIIQIADKDLNCARNIYKARIDKDGYIFSKSCKMLPEKEKVWIFLDNDYKEVKDKEGKVLYKYKECVDEFPYSFIDNDGNKKSFKAKEKRVVTYNPSLARKQILEITKFENITKDLCLFKAKKDEYGECAK